MEQGNDRNHIHQIPDEGIARWFARRYLNLITGLIFAASALFFIYFSFQIRVPMLGDPLGPRLFPNALATIYLILTIIFFVRLFTRDKQEDDSRNLSAQFRAGQVFMLLVLYVVALPYAGFVISTFIFSFVVLTFNGFRSVFVNFIAAVLIASTFRLLFETWLGIPLPTLSI